MAILCSLFGTVPPNTVTLWPFCVRFWAQCYPLLSYPDHFVLAFGYSAANYCHILTICFRFWAQFCPLLSHYDHFLLAFGHTVAHYFHILTIFFSLLGTVPPITVTLCPFFVCFWAQCRPLLSHYGHFVFAFGHSVAHYCHIVAILCLLAFQDALLSHSDRFVFVFQNALGQSDADHYDCKNFKWMAPADFDTTIEFV